MKPTKNNPPKNNPQRNALRRFDSAHTMTWIGASVMIFGCLMITAALIIPPPGIIDNSVLIAFGEISTFSATVMGVSTARRKRGINNPQILEEQ